MNLRQKVEEIKKRIGAKIIGRGKCYVCGCGISKRGMTVHHLWYIFDDVTYKKFLPRNDTNTLKYYTALEPLTKDDPKRFMYLCNTHHQALEKMNRYGDELFKKLIKARKMTKTKRNQ